MEDDLSCVVHLTMLMDGYLDINFGTERFHVHVQLNKQLLLCSTSFMQHFCCLLNWSCI